MQLDRVAAGADRRAGHEAESPFVGPGTVPILLSIQTLRKMGAIVDYGRNEAVFTRINPLKCLQLQTTTTGHQILPLTRDFMQEATVLQAPVHRLGVPAEE